MSKTSNKQKLETFQNWLSWVLYQAKKSGKRK
jgi:hypothetical protein